MEKVKYGGFIDLERKINKLLLWGSYYAFIVTGMIVLIPGAILPYLIKEFHLGYDQGGALLALQAIGNLAASLLGGIASDYIGRKATMTFGAICFIIGFCGILTVSVPILLFASMFIAGIGWGIQNSMINVVVCDASEGNGSIMNMLHMFFAIGAFAAPFLVSLIIKMGLSWRYAVALVVIMSVILVFVFLLMPIKSQKMQRERKYVSTAFWLNKRYYIFMAILFLYVGTENSINGWMVTYLSETHVLKIMTPQSLLAIFWLAIIAGRFLNAYISRLFPRESIILANSIGGAIFFIAFMLTANQIVILLSIVAMGLFLAGIYPTTVANASGLIKGSGTAAGIMMSLGGLGAAAVPYLNGLVAQGRGIYAGMTIIILSASLLVIAAFCNVWMERKQIQP